MTTKFTKQLLSLTAVVTLSMNVAEGQKITWGQLNTATSAQYYPTIMGEDKDNIYTFAQLKKDFVVERYDKAKKTQQYVKVVEPKPINGNEVTVEQVNFIDGKFIITASYFDKKTSHSNIYAFTINGADGSIIDKNVSLFSIPVEKKKRSGDFHVFVSEDNSKMLINHYAYYKDKKKYLDRYKLVDANLNVLAEKEDAFDKEDRDYSTSNYLIDNDGSIYFMKRYRNGNNSLVSYDANKSFEKWEEQIDLSDLGLGLKDKITDVRFTINKQNDLLLTGYYSKEKSDLDGTFFMKINNQSKEVVLTKLSLFDKKFKEQFLTQRQLAKGKENDLDNSFKSIEIVNKSDGGIVLIGEKYQHYYHRRGEYELYGDLIVLNFSPKGEMLWSHRIPKAQVYSYNTSAYPFVFGSFGISVLLPPLRVTEYFSYLSGVNKDKVYILFNDNPKNTLTQSDNDRVKPLKKVSKSAVTMYTIDLKTGEKKESLFLDAKDFQVQLKPVVSFQKDQNSDVISYGVKGKKYKYGVLTL